MIKKGILAKKIVKKRAKRVNRRFPPKHPFRNNNRWTGIFPPKTPKQRRPKWRSPVFLLHLFKKSATYCSGCRLAKVHIFFVEIRFLICFRLGTRIDLQVPCCTLTTPKHFKITPMIKHIKLYTCHIRLIAKTNQKTSHKCIMLTNMQRRESENWAKVFVIHISVTWPNISKSLFLKNVPVSSSGRCDMKIIDTIYEHDFIPKSSEILRIMLR